MKNKPLTGYLFILPLALLFLVFIVYPIVYNGVISFYDWNGISLTKTFTGWSNYKKVFADPVLKRILLNFLIFGVSTILIQAFLGILYASFFIRKLRFSGLYRIFLYMPVIITPTIISSIFGKILEYNQGSLNQLLRFAGLEFLTRQWLADPNLALVCLIVINIWQWTGYSMLIYYANMLNIPQDLYEAATIDGASPFQQFFRITLPLLRSTHFTLFVMGALGSLKCFDLPYILTRGGPNYATEFFSTSIYRKSFELFDQGGASATVMIMFAVALLITALQMRLYMRNDKEKELAST